jgi:hypothetical protein
MYLHLGQNVVVPQSSVIGIFDLDNTTGSHITRDFLSRAEKKQSRLSTSQTICRNPLLCAPKAAEKEFSCLSCLPEHC